MANLKQKCRGGAWGANDRCLDHEGLPIDDDDGYCIEGRPMTQSEKNLQRVFADRNLRIEEVQRILEIDQSSFRDSILTNAQKMKREEDEQSDGTPEPVDDDVRAMERE